MQYITPLDKAHAEADRIFRNLLPAHGLAVRQVQIGLCHEMLNALFSGQIALCDAGVGVGKTHAYLVAGLLWQKYHPRGLPHTLTISTSSIALQTAILKEYLPFLSRVLVEDRLLAMPVHTVIRKGRERYVCDRHLSERQKQLAGSEKVSAARRAALESLHRNTDLDDTAGLSHFDRTRVCVPADCSCRCLMYHICRYQALMKQARSTDVDIQICNHNFLIADAMHRQRGMRPLLKDYHALVIDEAHKLAETAQQMYGESFSFQEVDELCALLVQGHCGRMAQRLHMAGNMLAESMRAAKKENGTEISEQKYVLSPDIETALDTLITLLSKAKNPVYSLPDSTICALERAVGVLTLFSGANAEKETKRLLYIRYGYGGEMTLCAACQETPALLERDLWRQTGAAILTSGTLAAGRSFVRTRQLTGLEHHARCTEFTVQSPFDYEQNCLLYLPPDTSNRAGKEHEAEYLSRRICELIQAVHGHALILFTSYISMSDVCGTLRESLPYPLVQAWKGNHQAIRQFKTMPNAILCAAGSCWEGIDLPGDMVSLLVITHLPFPVPTPVSEAEKGQYADLQSYIRAVIIPEMQTKLRQGVGRAIRTETDTCVVAILDRRAAPGGRYYTEVKQALPPCPVTNDMAEVQQFIQARKSPEYFMS